MTCEELRALLELEGAVESEAASAHLQACSRCRSEVERWQVVEAALRDMGQEPAPPFLHSRIMAHVRAQSRRARVGSWIMGWRGTAVAAMAAAVVILGLGLWVLRLYPRADAKSASGHANHPPLVAVESKKTTASQATPSPSSTASPRVFPPARGPLETQPGGAKGGRVAGAAAVAPRTHPLPLPSPATQPSQEVGVLADAVALRPTEEARGVLSRAGGAATEAASETSVVSSVQEAKHAAEAVFCRLQLEGNGEVLELRLPAGAAPPPNEVWLVTVAPDGQIEVVDTRGRTQQISPLLQQALNQQQRQQQLRLGRYRLSQTSVRATPTP